MDQLGSRLKQLSSELREYLETRIDLLVLNVGDHITHWIGYSVQKILGFTVVGVGLFFGLTALAIYLGELLNNEAIGYAILALPIVLIGLLFILAKPFGIAKSIQKQLMEGILKSLEEEKPSSHLELTEHKELGKGKEHE